MAASKKSTSKEKSSPEPKSEAKTSTKTDPPAPRNILDDLPEELPDTVEINGMQFTPHPEAKYAHNYVKLAMAATLLPLDQQLDLYAKFIKQDLFFVLFFVLKVPVANKPFIVEMCRAVEDGPETNTLDIWAREHFKSTIITVAETIQHICRNPDSTTCILSYAKDAAKTFLRTIKTCLEESEFLHDCFPDIFYRNPSTQSSKWNEEALTVKRKGFRKEATVEAWGLIDGQPTGRHFDRLIYDDVVTDEVARSPDVMQKVKRAFDMSNNVGTDGGTRRVIGTFYHHDDPLTYIQSLKNVTDDTPLFTPRIRPATDTGEANGEPVLLSVRRLAELAAGDQYIFNCQQLCNPTPMSDMSLSPEFLKEVEPHEIPRCWKFMLVDPAGMQTQTKKRGDAWAMMVIGVRPFRDDLGASDVYILDAQIEAMTEHTSMENLVQMYKRNGRILKLCVEKVGMSSMEVHASNALRDAGVHLSIKSGTLALLSPAGRAKQTRIERNLSWPLRNGKVHISKAVPAGTRERLKIEMEKFPHFHDDGLDALSYIYDVIKDYIFGLEPPPESDEEEDPYTKYSKRFGSLDGVPDHEGWMVV